MQAKHPALIFSVAAPEDAAWLVQWERHLLPLQRGEHLRLYSERLVLAGENRLQQMSQQVDQADLVVFLLSSDFFASEECTTLMERAITRQHHEQVTLIPLLLRPSLWEDSPLHLFSCLPSQAQAVTSWRNADEAFQTCVEGIRQILGLPTKNGAEKRRFPLPPTRRLQVIRRLQQEYRQRRDHSLQGQVAIELGLHERTDVIASSTRLVFHDAEADHPLPAGTTIIQVYDQTQFGLLILGAPGAGKTTLLLDLAMELLQRAENNEEHPLPIILSLSLWATTRLAWSDWLCEQLYLIYGVARKVGASWVEQDQILFLLDGLDEVEESARSACIVAMNHYREEHFVPLIVSSRSREYELQDARLILPTAVEVQPLELAKIMTYLTQTGPTLAKVCAVIQTNTTLQQLITTPLMLMVILLTYRNQETTTLPQIGSFADLQQQIFQQYIQRMLHRFSYRRTFSTQRLLISLRWLAQQMQQRHLTEFYLESLQPTWLSIPQVSRYASLVCFALGLPFVVYTELVGGLFGGATGLIWGGIIWGICTLLIWLASKIGAMKKEIQRDIQPKDIILWSWESFWIAALTSVVFSLIVGTCAWYGEGCSVYTTICMPSISSERGVDFNSFFALLLASGLSIGLAIGLLAGNTHQQFTHDRRIHPNQGIQTSGRNALFHGLLKTILTMVMIGLSVSLLIDLLGGRILTLPSGNILWTTLAIGLTAGLLLGMFLGIINALLCGGIAYAKHYLLRFFLWKDGVLPWRAVPLLEEATDCILLQRVGSGYRFIHPLIQEHFASLDVEAILKQSKGQTKVSSDVNE